MKIITPISPFYNSTHNVSISTLKVIETRLKYGYNTMKLIFSGKVPCKDIFNKFHFFGEYKDYIEINVHGKNDEEYI